MNITNILGVLASRRFAGSAKVNRRLKHAQHTTSKLRDIEDNNFEAFIVLL